MLPDRDFPFFHLAVRNAGLYDRDRQQCCNCPPGACPRPRRRPHRRPRRRPPAHRRQGDQARHGGTGAGLALRSRRLRGGSVLHLEGGRGVREDPEQAHRCRVGAVFQLQGGHHGVGPGRRRRGLCGARHGVRVRAGADAAQPAAAYTFPSFHERILEPYNYYNFGQRYIRGLIDFTTSMLGNEAGFKEVEQQLKNEENVVLLANHQTEADPARVCAAARGGLPGPRHGRHLRGRRQGRHGPAVQAVLYGA